MKKNRSRRAAAALLAVGSLGIGAASPARADTPSPQAASSATSSPSPTPSLEAARREFAQGVASYDRKPPNYEDALAHFREAYREQPSPAIKRNIALCLRALGRNAEAVTALDEMLAEGGDALKPEVRDAAKRAMGEMAPKVAQVRVSVGFPGHPPEAEPDAEVTIDGVVVPTKRLGAVLNVEPGEHVFRAHVPGHADAEVTVTLAAGGPETSVSLDLLSIRHLDKGKLRVRSNLPNAEISLDGVVVGRGQWAGPLFSGRHAIDVASPVGRYTGEVVIAPGEDRLVTVMVSRTGSWAYGAGDGQPPPMAVAPPVVSAKPVDVPPLYVAPGAVVPKRAPPAGPTEATDAAAKTEKAELLKASDAAAEAARSKPYLLAGAAVHTMGVRLSPLMHDQSGSERSFLGASAVLRTGLAVTPWFQVGLLGEVGGTSTDYYRNGQGADVKVSSVIWAFAPEARLRTTGKVRGFVGLALGLTGLYVSARGGAVADVTRGGTGLVGLINAGLQVDIQKVFVELGAFADLRDVSAIGSSGGGNTFLFDQDVAARYGLQVMVGKEF